MWTEIYTTKEAAEYVDISYWEMATLLRFNIIPRERIGCAFFVDKSDLDEWIEMQKEKQKDEILIR